MDDSTKASEVSTASASVTNPMSSTPPVSSNPMSLPLALSTDEEGDGIEESLPEPPRVNPVLQKSTSAPITFVGRLEPPALLMRAQSDGLDPKAERNDATTKKHLRRLSLKSFKEAMPVGFAGLSSGSLLLPALLRSSSQVTQFYCQICLCNEAITAAYALEPCGHHFCRDCISQYLMVKVNEAQLSNFLCPFIDDSLTNAPPNGWTCDACTLFNIPAPEPGVATVQCSMCETSQAVPSAPAEPGCRALLSPTDLSNLLDDASKAKLARFQVMRENTNYRECPRCQFPNTVGPKAGSNRLVCGESGDAVDEEKGKGSDGGGCSHVYCFVHSDQHQGESCRQFELRHRQQEASAAAFISQFSRPCPGCKQPIEKSGGCNHMTCPNPACKCDFCWLCGRKISGGSNPDHFALWNVLGCPSMQMQEGLRSAGRSNRAQEAIQCVYRLSYSILVPTAAVVLLTFCIAYAAIAIGWFFVSGSIIVLMILPCLVIFAQFQTKDSGVDTDALAESLPWVSCAPLVLLYFCCGLGDSD